LEKRFIIYLVDGSGQSEDDKNMIYFYVTSRVLMCEFFYCRSPAAITPRGMKATSPVTAKAGEQQQQQQQQREIMFPYNIGLLTSCLGFPPIKTYRSSSSEFRSLVYGSP
jgi:hypothetical protein